MSQQSDVMLSLCDILGKQLLCSCCRIRPRIRRPRRKLFCATVRFVNSCKCARHVHRAREGPAAIASHVYCMLRTSVLLPMTACIVSAVWWGLSANRLHIRLTTLNNGWSWQNSAWHEKGESPSARVGYTLLGGELFMGGTI